MIDFLIFFLMLGFVTLAWWLKNYINQTEASLYISTEFSPEVDFDSFFGNTSNETNIKIKEWVKFAFIVFSLLVVAIVLDRYFFSDDKKYWFSLLVCTISIVVLFIINKRQKNDDKSTKVAGRGRRRQAAENTSVYYSGFTNIPVKAYEGDSYNLTLDLTSELSKYIGDVPSINIQNQDKKIDIGLNIIQDNKKDSLEIELLAAGFSIKGEQKQSQSFEFDTLRYQWNCFFQNSGTHSFILVFRIIGRHQTLELGRAQSKVTVVKLGNLTQRQIWVFATIASIVSGLLAIAEILKNLNVW